MKKERTWFAADKTGFHMLHTYRGEIPAREILKDFRQRNQVAASE